MRNAPCRPLFPNSKGKNSSSPPRRRCSTPFSGSNPPRADASRGQRMRRSTFDRRRNERLWRCLSGDVCRLRTSRRCTRHSSLSFHPPCWLDCRNEPVDAVRPVCGNGDARLLRTRGSRSRVYACFCRCLRVGLSVRFHAGRVALRPRRSRLVRRCRSPMVASPIRRADRLRRQ